MKKRKGFTWSKIKSDIPAGEKVVQIQSVQDGESYFWGLFRKNRARLIVLTEKGLYEQAELERK